VLEISRAYQGSGAYCGFFFRWLFCRAACASLTACTGSLLLPAQVSNGCHGLIPNSGPH